MGYLKGSKGQKNDLFVCHLKKIKKTGCRCHISVGKCSQMSFLHAECVRHARNYLSSCLKPKIKNVKKSDFY